MINGQCSMRYQLLYIVWIICAVAYLSACDMIEYHPYDVNIDGKVGLTTANCALIERQCAGKDTLRIAHISDTQRHYDETRRIVGDINRRDSIDFVINTGDLTDFGLTKEFEWQRDILNGLRVPYVCIIGNHDCLGTGEAVYRRMFGDDNFSFNASFLHIVCLNTNAYEYDYSRNVPNFAFMKQDVLALPDSVTSTIVAMHVAPGMILFNNNVAEYFDQVCHTYPGLRICICGHGHHQEELYPFGEDGTPYIQCDDAKDKSYVIYTITRNTCSYEVVHL